MAAAAGFVTLNIANNGIRLFQLELLLRLLLTLLQLLMVHPIILGYANEAAAVANLATINLCRKGARGRCTYI